MTVSVECFSGVDLSVFLNEVVPRNKPALLKGLAADWPAVKAAMASDEAACAYLKACDNQKPAEVMYGDPAIKGEFFYTPDLRGVNFTRSPAVISEFLDKLLARRDRDDAAALYLQSTPIDQHMPRFMAENRIGFMPSDIMPRIWIGNQLRVQTHYDLSNNIAIVVAGKRRFTLFPPEQLVNLYVGPFEFTLAGPPISMVSLENPDLERYPRFAEALEAAVVAELEPGDALYIPYFWWHHVRSLASFNVLVNYWWNDTRPGLGSPYDPLLHAILGIRDMPKAQRDVWKVMFDYYVFGSHGDPVAHLPPQTRGPLGGMTPDLNMKMRRQLVHALSRTPR